MDTNGAKAALAALESASLEAADRLKTAHGNLDEMARVEAEGVTLYLHKLAAEACAEPDAAAAPAAAAPDAAQNADPSAEKGPGVPRRVVTALPASASAAYVASARTAALLHGEVDAALGALKRRLGSLQRDLSAPAPEAAPPAAGGDGDDGGEAAAAAVQKQMDTYSRRAIVGAGSACVSGLGGASVHALGELTASSLRTLVELEGALERALPPPPPPADGAAAAASAAASSLDFDPDHNPLAV